MWQIIVFIIVIAIFVGLIIYNSIKMEPNTGYSWDVAHSFYIFCNVVGIIIFTLVWGSIFWW